MLLVLPLACNNVVCLDSSLECCWVHVCLQCSDGFRGEISRKGADSGPVLLLNGRTVLLLVLWWEFGSGKGGGVLMGFRDAYGSSP